jgi:tetratricopeptide (TPR) repeat protein
MSKRQPGQSRSKQSQGEPDDLFIARVLELRRWAQANQQVMTVLGVLAVIAVAGVFYYGNYRRGLNDQAAQSARGRPPVDRDRRPAGRPGPADDVPRALSGTAYEGEARLLLGEMYLKNGQPQQAQAVLEPLGAPPAGSDRPPGYHAPGQGLRAGSAVGRCGGAYLRVADRSDLSFQINEALSSAARLRAEQGNATGAIALYQQALERLEENDPMRGHFEMRIAELEVRQDT